MTRSASSYRSERREAWRKSGVPWLEAQRRYLNSRVSAAASLNKSAEDMPPKAIAALWETLVKRHHPNLPEVTFAVGRKFESIGLKPDIHFAVTAPLFDEMLRAITQPIRSHVAKNHP